MESQAQQEELSRPGLGHNNPPGSFRVFPSLSGRRARISERDDPETRRGLCRENETACNLVANGHDVEQSPKIAGRKNPDYLIDGKAFDKVAPITTSLRNIRSTIQKKVEGNQARNIILNLRDTPVTVKEIDNYLLFYAVDGLEKLWIIDRWGEIHYLRGGKR